MIYLLFAFLLLSFAATTSNDENEVWLEGFFGSNDQHNQQQQGFSLIDMIRDAITLPKEWVKNLLYGDQSSQQNQPQGFTSNKAMLEFCKGEDISPLILACGYLGIVIAALVYMAGEFFTYPKYKAIAAEMIGYAISSAVIYSVFLMVKNFVDGHTFSYKFPEFLPGHDFNGNLVDLALAVQKHVIAIAFTSQVITGYLLSATAQVFQISIPVPIGRQFVLYINIQKALTPLMRALFDIANLLGWLTSLAFLQMAFLCFVQKFIFGLLLPLFVGLRVFRSFRRVANFLIAVSFSFYLIYLPSFFFTAELLNEAMEAKVGSLFSSVGKLVSAVLGIINAAFTAIGIAVADGTSLSWTALDPLFNNPDTVGKILSLFFSPWLSVFLVILHIVGTTLATVVQLMVLGQLGQTSRAIGGMLGTVFGGGLANFLGWFSGLHTVWAVLMMFLVYLLSVASFLLGLIVSLTFLFVIIPLLIVITIFVPLVQVHAFASGVREIGKLLGSEVQLIPDILRII